MADLVVRKVTEEVPVMSSETVSQYEFPVYEKRKDKEGNLVEVERRVERTTREALVTQAAVIQTKIDAIDALK